MDLPVGAKRFALAVIASGAVAFAGCMREWTVPGWPFLLYVVLAAASSGIKIRLESIQGYFTPNFLFVLAGVVYFSLSETVIACCAAGFGMSLLNAKVKPKPIQIAFNVANLVLSGSVAFIAAHSLFGEGITRYRPAWFAMVTTVYFVVNTTLVSGILSLVGKETFRVINARYYLTSFPYYLVGAAAVGVLPLAGSTGYNESWLILAPLVYLAWFFDGLGRGDAANAIMAVERTGSGRGNSKYPAVVAAAGAMLLVLAVIHWESHDPARFVAFSAVGIAASFPRVSLPGIRGAISAGVVVVMAAAIDLTLSETILMATFVSLPPAFAKTRNRKIHPLFATSALIIAAAVTAIVCRWPLGDLTQASMPAALLLTAFFLGAINTGLMSSAICLAEGRPMAALFERFYFWGLPYYLVGSAAAGLIVATWRSAGWAPALLVVPVLALVGLSYQLHVRSATDGLQKA